MTERFARISETALQCREMWATDWRVLVCIGLHADPAGHAYPGMTTLAEMTGVRRQDVPRAVSRLIRFGLLQCDHAAGPNGSNMYTLLFDEPKGSAQVRTVRVDADPQGRGQGVRVGASKGSASTRTKQTKEQTIEHIHARRASQASAAGNETDEWFETFWRAFPSRKPHENPKKPARLKFEAAVKRGVDPATIVRGAENFAVYAAAHISSPKFIRTAEVWLNKECWTEHQETLAPEPLRAGMI